MMHDAIRSQLNDYVDQSLDAAAMQVVQRHLSECQACRDEASRLEALVSTVRSLPPTIDPPADLWPRIDPELSPRRLFDRSLWASRYTLAAAAVLLVLASSAVSFWVANRSSSLSRLDPQPTAARFVDTELQYVQAVAALEEELLLVKENLSPEVWAVIDKNLRIIDQAINEIRAVLAADPANGDVADALAGVYRKKLDVLRHATQMSVQT